MTLKDVKPGQKLRVRQEIDRREGNWVREIVGVVQEVTMQPTGSWYAHSKDDKFWLARIMLRKDDGELSLLNVDRFTRIDPA